jgi:hypothetical protein
MSSMVFGFFILAVPFMLLGCGDGGATTPAPTTTVSPAYGMYQWTTEDLCPVGEGWMPPTPRAKRVVYGECMSVSNESALGSWLWQGPTYDHIYDQNLTWLFYFNESQNCTGSRSNPIYPIEVSNWISMCDLSTYHQSHAEWTISLDVSLELYGTCGVPPTECSKDNPGIEEMESLI